MTINIYHHFLFLEYCYIFQDDLNYTQRNFISNDIIKEIKIIYQELVYYTPHCFSPFIVTVTFEALSSLESMITLSWVSLIVFFNLFYQFLLLFLLISSVCTHAPLYTCIHKHTHTDEKLISSVLPDCQPHIFAPTLHHLHA